MEHLTVDEITPREKPQDVIAADGGALAATPEPELDRVLARAIRRLIAEARGTHAPAPVPGPTI